MLSIFMLCVFWLHESRGQPGANCVWQAEERQPTANVRVDSSPHLFSFSLGSLGLQDRAINHQKQHTCSAVTFYSVNKRSSSQGAEGTSVPNPHPHAAGSDNLQPPWLSACFLLMEPSSLPVGPEEVFINQLFSWALFSRLNQRGFVS